jgi:hypothetical protein
LQAPSKKTADLPVVPEPSAKVDKKAEKAKADEAKKKEAAAKAKAEKDLPRKKKSNGFKLFGSQMLILGGFAAGVYAVLFKSDELSGLMGKADKAIMEATGKKEGDSAA